MKCDLKIMMKIAAGVGAAFLVAYLALHDSRALFLALSPFLLVLLCPLAMGIMMLAMQEESTKSNLDESSQSVGRPSVRDKL